MTADNTLIKKSCKCGKALYHEEFYVDLCGKKNGEYKRFYENGNLWMLTAYKNDQLDGKYESFHEEEGRWISTEYKNGKIDGEYFEWDKKGRLIEFKHYEDGRVVSKIGIDSKDQPEEYNSGFTLKTSVIDSSQNLVMSFIQNETEPNSTVFVISENITMRGLWGISDTNPIYSVSIFPLNYNFKDCGKLRKDLSLYRIFNYKIEEGNIVINLDPIGNNKELIPFCVKSRTNFTVNKYIRCFEKTTLVPSIQFMEKFARM